MPTIAVSPGESLHIHLYEASTTFELRYEYDEKTNRGAIIIEEDTAGCDPDDLGRSRELYRRSLRFNVSLTQPSVHSPLRSAPGDSAHHAKPPGQHYSKDGSVTACHTAEHGEPATDKWDEVTCPACLAAPRAGSVVLPAVEMGKVGEEDIHKKIIGKVLEEMNATELRKYARDEGFGISYLGERTKAELLKIIRAQLDVREARATRPDDDIRPCPGCAGSGNSPTGKSRCDICGGKKEINISRLMRLPIQELELTVRAHNCLEMQGIKTVQDIYDFDARDIPSSNAAKYPGLWSIRHMGARSVKDIELTLTDLGLPKLKHGYKKRGEREINTTLGKIKISPCSIETCEEDATDTDDEDGKKPYCEEHSPAGIAQLFDKCAEAAMFGRDYTRKLDARIVREWNAQTREEIYRWVFCLWTKPLGVKINRPEWFCTLMGISK